MNNEPYNLEFTLDDLTRALSLSHNSAPGPDDVHYEMLRHLPTESLNLLLNLFNEIWVTGSFPPSYILNQLPL